MKHPRFERTERRDPLRVVPLLLPRAWRGPAEPWEIQRGYRLRVVDPATVVLTLGALDKSGPPTTLSHASGPGEESLVVLVAPTGPTRKGVQSARELAVADRSCLLILSDRRQVQSYGEVRREIGQALRGGDFPAAWILDDMPQVDFRGLPYFTVERSLRQLGRVGRRLKRWAGYRRLIPW